MKRNFKKTSSYLVFLFALVLCFASFAHLGQSTSARADDTNPAPSAIWDKTSGGIATDFAGGDGLSAETAYLISTAEQLAFLAFKVDSEDDYSQNKFFKLTNDIMLNDDTSAQLWSSIQIDSSLNTWDTPIGKAEEPRQFKGTFDGAGFSIRGLYIYSSQSNLALFGTVATTGVVKNLKLGAGLIYIPSYAGSIAVRTHGIIDNCHSAVNIKTTLGGINRAGGIVALSEPTAIVRNCSSSASVTGANDAGNYIGGIVGRMNESKVYNCYASGSIGTGPIAGGIVGAAFGGTVANSYFVGSVADGSSIVHYSDASSPDTYIISCYALSGKNPSSGIAVVTDFRTVNEDGTLIDPPVNSHNDGSKLVYALNAFFIDEASSYPGMLSWVSEGNYATFSASIAQVTQSNFRLNDAYMLTPYSQGQAIKATKVGYPDAQFIYTVVSSDLPQGLSFNTIDRQIFGSPSTQSPSTGFSLELLATDTTSGFSFTITYALDLKKGDGSRDPAYTALPANIMAVAQQKINTIILPQGWAWNLTDQDATTQEVDGVDNRYTATYTPSIPDSFNSIENVSIPITVSTATVTVADFYYSNNLTITPIFTGPSQATNIQYYYSATGNDNWTSDVPSNSGVYFIRATYLLSGITIQSPSSQFEIFKATVDPSTYEVPSTIEAVYSETLEDLVLQLKGYDERWRFVLPLTTLVGAAGTKSVDIYLDLEDPNNYLPVEKTVTLNVSKFVVALPVIPSVVYTGSAHTAVIPESPLYTIGTNSAVISANSYPRILTLKDFNNYEWDVENPTSANVTIYFVVEKRVIQKPASEISLPYKPQAQTIISTSIYYSLNGTYTATAVGSYQVSITLNGNCIWDDGTSNIHTINWTIERIRLEKPEAPNDVIYNATSQTADIATSEYYTVYGGTQIAAGEYSVLVIINDSSTYSWSDGSVSTLEFIWTIEANEVEAPLAPTNVTFNGSLQTALASTDKYIVIGGEKAPVGEYLVEVKLIDPINYKWKSGTTANLFFEWNITPARITKPSAPEDVVYDGNVQTAEIIENLHYIIKGNIGANAGNYQIEITLKDVLNTTWEDETTEALSFEWFISRAPISIPIAPSNNVYNSQNQVAISGSADYYVVGGERINAGEYEVLVKLVDPNNTMWEDETVLDKVFPWIIAKKEVTKPSAPINSTFDKFLKTAIVATEEYYVIGGERTTAGVYEVEVRLIDSINTMWKGGDSSSLFFEWTIARAQVPIPAAPASVMYDGTSQLVGILTSPLYRIHNATQTRVGKHTITIVLVDTNNYEWSDGKIDDIVYEWEITENPNLNQVGTSCATMEMGGGATGGLGGLGGGLIILAMGLLTYIFFRSAKSKPRKTNQKI